MNPKYSFMTAAESGGGGGGGGDDVCDSSCGNSLAGNLSKLVFWVTFVGLTRRVVYDYHLFHLGLSDSPVSEKTWRHTTWVVLMAGIFLGVVLSVIGFLVVDECGQAG